MILAFLCPPTKRYVDSFILHVDKNGYFWTTYPPHLVHVVIERPLRTVLVLSSSNLPRMCHIIYIPVANLALKLVKLKGSWPKYRQKKVKSRQDKAFSLNLLRHLNPGMDKACIPKLFIALLDKAHPNFWVQAAEDSQFCQALRYQDRSKGLVWHYINIDAMIETKLTSAGRERFTD